MVQVYPKVLWEILRAQEARIIADVKRALDRAIKELDDLAVEQKRRQNRIDKLDEILNELEK
jgi:hypothetical protein